MRGFISNNSCELEYWERQDRKADVVRSRKNSRASKGSMSARHVLDVISGPNNKPRRESWQSLQTSLFQPATHCCSFSSFPPPLLPSRLPLVISRYTLHSLLKLSAPFIYIIYHHTPPSPSVLPPTILFHSLRQLTRVFPFTSVLDVHYFAPIWRFTLT